MIPPQTDARLVERRSSAAGGAAGTLYRATPFCPAGLLQRLVRSDCRPGPAALRPLFIPRRVIHAGNRDVVQAKIDAQDRTVVDQMVEDEGPNRGRSRHG